MRSLLTLIAVLLLAAACTTRQTHAQEPPAQYTTITGRVLGFNGDSLRMAKVYLFRHATFVPITIAEAGPDGTFALRIDGLGLFTLKFTGAQHREHSITILIDHPRTAGVDVRLGMFASVAHYDSNGRVERIPLERSASAFGGSRIRNDDSIAAVLYHDPDMQRFAEITARLVERRRMTGEGSRCDGQYDWSVEAGRLAAEIRMERDPFIRRALLLSYVELGRQGATGLDPKIARRALADIPPASVLWSLYPEAVGCAMRLSGTPMRYEDYRWAVINGHPDTSARIRVLLAAVTEISYRKEPGRFLSYYNELMGKYMRGRDSEYVASRYNPNRTIRTGRPVPAFAIPSLDDSTVMISDESMKGKVYLIDFWATWCGPCIAELDYLHAVYEKYRERNFEIVSFSFNSTPRTVTKFREGKWKMPWRHVFVVGDFSSDLAKQFEVVGIPKPILVDTDGTIIAADEELRGPALERTLENYFAKK